MDDDNPADSLEAFAASVKDFERALRVSNTMSTTPHRGREQQPVSPWTVRWEVNHARRDLAAAQLRPDGTGHSPDQAPPGDYDHPSHAVNVADMPLQERGGYGVAQKEPCGSGVAGALLPRVERCVVRVLIPRWPVIQLWRWVAIRR